MLCISDHEIPLSGYPAQAPGPYPMDPKAGPAQFQPYVPVAPYPPEGPAAQYPLYPPGPPYYHPTGKEAVWRQWEWDVELCLRHFPQTQALP